MYINQNHLPYILIIKPQLFYATCRSPCKNNSTNSKPFNFIRIGYEVPFFLSIEEIFNVLERGVSLFKRTTVILAGFSSECVFAHASAWLSALGAFMRTAAVCV
jgi:hypothetical protein